MPQDPAATLSSLLRAATIDDHEEVLKAANAALKADKTDLGSQHTRIVALLKLDRFDDVLRALADGGVRLEAQCVLEKAYALYKTARLDDAVAVLKAAGLDRRSFQHVAAQVAYRAERFDEAREIYRRILDTDPGHEEHDLAINLAAALAQAEWQGFASFNRPEPADSDGFELCYNTACALIARGDLYHALDLLQRALRLCDGSDDLTEDDKHAEMRPILAQQAFVYAKLGKLKEALDLYRTLGTTDDSDPDFSLLAQNNLLALDRDTTNPYLTQRKYASAASSEQAAKLFSYQSSFLRRNGFVVDLRAQKVRGVKYRTRKLLDQAQHPTTASDINLLSVLNAAAAAHGFTGKAALRSLLELSSKNPDEVGLVLTIIQLQLEQHRTGAALSTLESFLARLEKSETMGAADIRSSPGLVALTVSLMRAQGRETSAKAELVKAAAHWQDRPAASATSLLKEAGIELLRSSNPDDLRLAGSSFQKLFAEQQGSHLAAAGLVASLAPSEPSQVRQHLDDLPPVESLVEGIDIASLLGAGVASTAKSVQLRKRPAAEDTGDRATKKRRRTKLPKNYDASKKPDPERWLPLRDRSSYRPKGKKGKKKAGESTQGGLVKEEETLELVGGGGVKVEKAPAVSASKKKKKGKK